MDGSEEVEEFINISSNVRARRVEEERTEKEDKDESNKL